MILQKKNKLNKTYRRKKIAGNNQDSINEKIETNPLVNAIKISDITTIQHIVSQPNFNINAFIGKDNYTPLMYAAEAGEPKIVEFLVKLPNINVNLKDTEGLTAIYVGYNEIKKIINYYNREEYNKLDKYYVILIILLNSGIDTLEVNKIKKELEYDYNIINNEREMRLLDKNILLDVVKQIYKAIEIYYSISEFWTIYFDLSQSLTTKLHNILSQRDSSCRTLRNAELSNPSFMVNLSNFSSTDHPDIEYHFCLFFTIVSILYDQLDKDATILVKGGKSVQLLLPTTCTFKSTDIDYLVISNNKNYTSKELVRHILNFIMWFTMNNYHFQYIFLDNPTSKIMKITYVYPNGRKVPITDIGYGDDLGKLKYLFYNKTDIIDSKIKFNINSEESIYGKLSMQKLNILINEKLYYIDYYTSIEELSKPIEVLRKNVYYVNKTIVQILSIIQCLISLIKTNPSLLDKILIDYGYVSWGEMNNRYNRLVIEIYKLFHMIPSMESINKYILLNGFYNEYNINKVRYENPSKYSDSIIKNHIMKLDIIPELTL